jgi:hypothetical protein
VITGFNTDIKHNNRVFHVQTEDKGSGNPYIESLVYVGGEIVASKKSSYADMVKGERDEKAVQHLMEQQHRLVIAAIQRGRFDGPDGSVQAPRVTAEAAARAAVATPPSGASTPHPPRAPGSDKTLDQVILDYLASEVTQEHLEIELFSHPDFIGGQAADVRLKAETSIARQPVVGASVQIKVISTVDKPVILFRGKTAADGSCGAHVQIPDYKDGNAALIIQATSSFGNSEIKFLIHKRR